MPRSPAGTPPPATPTPPHTPLRSDGPLRTVTGLLDSKEKVYMQSLDSEYHSHVQWLRCMILLAKKRVIEDTSAEQQPTRQSPKKPRRSVMEAAAVAQVKNKVKFFNQLSTASPPSSTQTPSKPPRPLISTAVALPHVPANVSAPAAPTAPTTVVPPIASPPPLAVPEAPLSDYTAVFGRLNLNDTLVGGGGLGTITELNDSSTCKDGGVGMQAEAVPCATAEALASDLRQLSVMEEQEEDDEVAGAVGMELVVEGTQTAGKGEGPQAGSTGRESVEEVLCDFRSGYVKPWTPVSMQVKPFSSIISAAQSGDSGMIATSTLHTTTTTTTTTTGSAQSTCPPVVPPPKPLKPPSPPVAEPEGPEPIIEYNQKRPVKSPPTAVGDVSSHAPAALPITSPEPLASATGAAQFFKKIASAFHLGPFDATKGPYPPIEGFDTVQESYAMSDSDSAEERNGYSDDDDDEDDLGGRAQKKIPAWARGQVLAAALERQFNVSAGGSWVDPDTIFPEVTTCNLEEIFKVRKKRYYKRTSSGNWGQDAIKPCEKLAYKRQLGFDKSTH